MRREQAPVSMLPSDNSSWAMFCAFYNSAIPAKFRAYLGYCPVDPDTDATQSLLHALKTAAEVYLGHGICFSNISLPDRHAAGGYQSRVIEKANRNIGLTQAIDNNPDAFSMTLVAKGLDNFSDLDYLWLVVDYSV